MDIFDQVEASQKANDPGKNAPVSAPASALEVRMVKTVDGTVPCPLPAEDNFTDGAAPPPKIYRDASGRFQKGNDGGPGRPPSFAWLAREITGNGLEILAYAAGILRGEVKTTITGVSRMTGEPWVEQVECSAALKWEAAKWLKEQGFGKEVQRMELSGPDGSPMQVENSATGEECPDLSKLTTEEVRVYLQLRKKTLARPVVVDAKKTSAPAITDAEIVQGPAAAVTVFK